jgi:membrane protease subunit HflK
VLEQYKRDKDVTRRRIYLETMRGVMGGMDKVLIDTPAGGQGVVPYLPLPELKNNRKPAAPTPAPAPQPTMGTKR